ncbi:MAG: Holliday junction resolvase RuvX [Aquiluna sp.]
MGLDVGAARIGVAFSEGSLALAHGVVEFSQSAARDLATMAAEKHVSTIFVGLPLSLSGERTKSSLLAIDFARTLTSFTDTRISMVDERLTTVSAQRNLHQVGKSSKQSKSFIDAESARGILEFALSSPHVAIEIGAIDA